jgi:D-alanyl-lipoteichoic acid acyltransferase DltB (MBOAT superfamily)
MVFNSLQFLVFFGIVTSAYFLLAHKYRWALLLAASCYFYMAFVPIYLGILGLTIVIDYFAGIYLERFQGDAKKIFLGCSLLANLGVLAIFKYYFFFTDNVNALSSYFSIPIHFPVLNFLLQTTL